MTTVGKDTETEAEKNATLFAELIEYREALAALKEFGPGFVVTVQRHWDADASPPSFHVLIQYLPLDAKVSLNSWLARANHTNLLAAVRLAVKQARERQASAAQPPATIRLLSGVNMPTFPHVRVFQEDIMANLHKQPADPTGSDVGEELDLSLDVGEPEAKEGS